MLFSSLTFLWIFLPIVLAIYYLCSFIKNKYLQYKFKNVILLIASIFFYASGGLNFLFVMITSIVGNYLFAFFINKTEVKKTRKVIFIFSLIFNIVFLFYFKYSNFFVDILEGIINVDFNFKKVILPIGISFFTFQSMSYVVDVYLRKAKCQKNIIYLALYISLFPQLIAGPIVKYIDVENQIKKREESVDKFYNGIRRFIYGLAKKVIISNSVGQVADNVFGISAVGDLSTPYAWIGIICYTIQIYYDFSGYSDMAIGLGKMFGFDFNENFNYPYMSTSIKEFWRRWHISLSTWFKEYVYIPLGGNRKGKIRTYFNLFIVFVLTGFWHGANWTFLVWGIVYGLILIAERGKWGRILEKNKFKFLNWIYTIFVVMFLWVFFRASYLGYGIIYSVKMLIFDMDSTIVINEIINLEQWIMLFIGILFAGFMQKILKKTLERVNKKLWFYIIENIFIILLYFISINLLISNSFNPFIYFQF